MIAEDFKEILDKYPEEKEKPPKDSLFASDKKKEFEKHLDDFLEEIVDIDDYKRKLTFKARYGQWRTFPWLGIRNVTVAKNFKKGLYIWIGFYNEPKILYISINQGLTDSVGNKILTQRAEELSNKINIENDFLSHKEGLNVGKDKEYGGKTAIVSKVYSHDEINEATLERDLKKLIEIYESLIPEYKEIINDFPDGGDNDSAIKKLKDGRNRYNTYLGNKVRKKEIRIQTQNDYINRIDDFIDFIKINNIDCDEISVETLDKYAEEFDLSVSTKETYKYYISKFLQYIGFDIPDLPEVPEGISEKDIEKAKNDKKLLNQLESIFDKQNVIPKVLNYPWILNESLDKYKRANYNFYTNDKVNMPIKNLFDNYFGVSGYNCAKNVWLLAPGKKAILWDDFKENNLISIGCGEEMGNLSKYNDSDEIMKALKNYFPKKYPPESNPYNDVKCYLDFPKEMRIGDLVFIKGGIKKLLGVGIVTSNYNFLEDSPIHDNEYNHVREVQWIKTDDDGDFDLPSSIGQFVTKALTNVTYYDDYCFSLAKALDLSIVEYFCKDTLLNVFSKSKNLFNSYKNILRNIGYGRVTSFKFFFEGDIKKYLDNNYENIEESYKNEVIELFDDFINKKGDPPVPTYSKEDFLKEVVFIEKDYDKLVNLIERKKNIILQGSPGVGKTFIAKRLAYSIMGVKDENRVEFVQFHQSYSYEDFIQGYRPSGDGFELNNGVFYNFCRKASEDLENDYYFIIDEINRGNISKIFGELMMLIEDDKRGEDFGIHLTYSEKGPRFYVPENVYIIGMMNTADRSLAIIDYALRRRFVFYLIPPLFDEDSSNDNIFKNHLIENGVGEDLAIKIIEKFSILNGLILDDEDLGYGFRIGHSYFCGKGAKTDKWYKSIVNYEIAPLLKEYWFDDLEKAENEVKKLLDI